MSRRKRRYENRQLKRKQKAEAYKQYDDFEKVASLQSLYTSAWKASNGVKWKASTQRYLINILFRIWQTRQDLLKGKDIRKGFICFDINERGKVRHIKSVHFSERVVQKSLCSNVLYPVFTRNLIYENTASQKGKGTDFAQNILINQLRTFIKKYGADGYVLMIDFKSYFENIEHEPLKEMYRKHFKDERLLKLAFSFIDAFGEKGLGLGSETSQINAIVYINEIDHFIKSQFKPYGRYNDDSYIVDNCKQKLKKLFESLQVYYKKYGITINKKKTCIVKLKQGFKFLKTRFSVTDLKKILKKACRCSITQERRKLKKQIKLYFAGELGIAEIKQSFESWVGSMLRRDSRKTVYEMRKIFLQIYERELKNGNDVSVQHGNGRVSGRNAKDRTNA